jgi:hypothetical protein
MAIACLIAGLFIALYLHFTREKPARVKCNLQPSFSPVPPFQTKDTYGFKYRLKITNMCKISAENVTVSLLEIRPRPCDPTFSTYKTAFPYTVYTDTGAESSTINPGDGFFFEIARSWVGSDDKLRIGTIAQQPPFNSQRGSFAIDPDENWHLHLKISSANAGTEEAILSLRPFQGRLDMGLVI